MPRKKKTKENSTFDQFELQFTDNTLLQANGDYKRVKKLMKDDVVDEWVLNSRLSILSPFGYGVFELDFYHDKRVYITNFVTNSWSSGHSPELRCLNIWCQSAGWNVPQIVPHFAREKMDFWKNMWKSGVIDSDFFDEMFGKRQFVGQEEVEVEIEDEQED